MIKAIFYARFHPEKGPIIAHEVPPNSISNTTAPSPFDPPPPPPVAQTEDHLSSAPANAAPTTAAPAAPAAPAVAPHASAQAPILDFPVLSQYLVPPQFLCNRILTLRSPTTPHLIISHPICIADPSYDRNEFIFNIGIVIDDDRAPLHRARAAAKAGNRGVGVPGNANAGPPGSHHNAHPAEDARKGRGTGEPIIDRGPELVEAYKGIVTRVASVLRDLEIEKSWLTKDAAADETRALRLLHARSATATRSLDYSAADDPLALHAGSKVFALCEMVLEDLNCYGECMIPIDETTTLSLRLMPWPPRAPTVHSYHVPVLLVSPSRLQTSTWDLALQSLLPHIDGVNAVSRIAALADADTPLACEAIRQLVRLGCAVLLDVFSFGASYAVTPEVVDALVCDEQMQAEGARFVTLPRSGMDDAEENENGTSRRDGAIVEPRRFVELLCSLKQGVRLRDWCIERADELAGVDVRRLVVFGVLTGLLYRVAKFAVRTPGAAASSSSSLTPLSSLTALSTSAGNDASGLSISPGTAHGHENKHDVQIGKGIGTVTGTGNGHGNGAGQRNATSTNTTAVVTGNNATGSLPTHLHPQTQTAREAETSQVRQLRQYLDGRHNFDQICTEMGMSDGEVMSALKGEDVQIIYR